MESVILRRLRTYTSVPNGARKGICQVDELSSESVLVKMLSALSIVREQERKKQIEQKKEIFIFWQRIIFENRNLYSVTSCINFN